MQPPYSIPSLTIRSAFQSRAMVSTFGTMRRVVMSARVNTAQAGNSAPGGGIGGNACQLA